MNRIQYGLMKIEILTDPIVRSYAGMTDQQVLDDLYTLTRSRNKASMTGKEVADEVTLADWDTLTDAKKAQFLALIARDDLDPFGYAEQVIKDIFGAPSDTVTALATARVETISRVTELGLGKPGLPHVMDARN